MSKLIYVTAQPDVQYFHWQCEVYSHNFVEKGVNPSDIHMIFGMVNTNKPSKRAMELRKEGFNVHFYEDKRDTKNYIPSIKPYLISQWLKSFPKYGECFFLHDADIIFREKPNYEKYLKDNVCYLADTKSYLSYDYLKYCDDLYSKNYGLKSNEFINGMIDIFGIGLDCVIKNNDNTGGGQYIIKKTNYKNWFKIYNDSNSLYNYLVEFTNTHPVSKGIQVWTAEMWALIWNLWCLKKETKIIEDLDFSWATDDIDIYYKKPILHMAGVLEIEKNNKFFKGEFIECDPIQKLRENENFFEYVDKRSSTIKYTEVLKSLFQKQNTDYL